MGGSMGILQRPARRKTTGNVAIPGEVRWFQTEPGAHPHSVVQVKWGTLHCPVHVPFITSRSHGCLGDWWSGYIGSVCVESLCNSGHTVTVLDNLTEGHRSAVDPRARFVKGTSATSPLWERLMKETAPGAVIHLPRARWWVSP